MKTAIDDRRENGSRYALLECDAQTLIDPAELFDDVYRDDARRKLTAIALHLAGDPTDRDAAWYEIEEEVDCLLDDLVLAGEYESDRMLLEVASGGGWAGRVSRDRLDDPETKAAWRNAYRSGSMARPAAPKHAAPPCQPGRHRRASGARPVHLRGSRRCGSRASASDGDGGSEPASGRLAADSRGLTGSGFPLSSLSGPEGWIKFRSPGPDCFALTRPRNVQRCAAPSTLGQLSDSRPR